MCPCDSTVSRDLNSVPHQRLHRIAIDRRQFTFASVDMCGHERDAQLLTSFCDFHHEVLSRCSLDCTFLTILSNIVTSMVRAMSGNMCTRSPRGHPLANDAVFLKAQVVHRLVYRFLDLLPVRTPLDKFVNILCFRFSDMPYV